jgi:hypothetical protein
MKFHDVSTMLPSKISRINPLCRNADPSRG